ncbi:MAG: dermatan 4-sulfotransferase 1 [Actinomycetota bacterium]|jgi:hypothetical protein
MGETDAGLDAKLAVAEKTTTWIHHSRASLQWKYLCVATPKVACSTVKRTLHELEGMPPAPTIGHDHVRGHEIRLAAYSREQTAMMLTSPDWLRFSFVRNPYDRFFSAWKSKILSPTNTQYVWLREQIRQHFGYPVYEGATPAPAAFGDFARFILGSKEPAIVHDGHWELQTTVLMPDVIDYDVIGHFESFVTDFHDVLVRIDAPEYLQKIGAETTNPTEEIPLLAGYDEELADMVYEKYKPDFDNFGYARDSWITGELAPGPEHPKVAPLPATGLASKVLRKVRSRG